MNTTARGIELYLEACESRDREARASDDFALSILAGETVTLFGKPARMVVEWPEGPPGRMTADGVRELAAKWLADRRARRSADAEPKPRPAPADRDWLKTEAVKSRTWPRKSK